MSDNDKPEEGHVKYAVECDPKKPVKDGEKTATDGCACCGGKHDDVTGSKEG